MESISKKLYSLVILAILPALAILLYSGLENRRQSIEHAQSQILFLTHTMAEAQQDLTDSVKQMLATLSLIPQIQSADRNVCNEVFRSVLKQNPNYVNITLTDLKGEVLASAKPLTTKNLGDRKHVRGVLKTKKFSIGEYIISRIGDATPAFAFAYPVFDKNSNLKAVLTAPIKLSHFSSFYDFSNLPKQSFVAITDQKGIRLLYYPPKENTNPVGKPIKTTNWEKARKAEEPGFFISQGSDGLQRIFAFEQVRFKPDETPYIYVWAGTPEVNILAPVNAALIRNLILLLLTTLLSLFISWLIGKKTILSPIQSLVDLTRKFTEGNFVARSEIMAKSGELGTLAKAFNDMADRLSKNQRTLRESEERFKTLFEYAPEAYFLSDTEGHFLDGNRKAEILLGYHRERIIRNDFLELDTLLVEKINKTTERLAKSRDGEPTGPDELTLKKEDGRKVVVEISTHPIRIRSQDVVLWIARDITKPKQAEEALKKSETLLKETGRVAKVGGWELDAKTLEVSWTEETYHIYEIPVGQIPSLEEAIDFFHPDDRPKLELAIQKALQYGEPYDIEVRFTTAKGTHLWTHTMCKPIVVGGKTIKLTGTFQDITERKQAELALRDSEERYRLLFHRSNDGIFIHDLGGNIIDANQKTLKLFGYTKSELLSIQMPLLHPFEVHEKLKWAFEKIIRKGSVRFEIEFIKKNGEVFPAEVSSSLFEIDGKKIIQGIVTDITERKQAEEERKRLQAQFQQAQKMKAIGTLAGGIAHNFNNILMGIQGRTSLMMIGKDHSHPDYEKLHGISESVKSAAELTKDLLGFARGGKYDPKITDLNALIRNENRLFGRMAMEIQIHGKYEKELWPAEVDRGQIQQTLLNLYVNAWQAMPGGGDLHIQTENVIFNEPSNQTFVIEAGRYIKISVTDTGTGMDDATLKKIFEPFFSTKNKNIGSGLGLASAYGIVKNHGGSIDVNSQKGKGSTFTIYLPASIKEPMEDPLSLGFDQPEIQYGKGSILLVDDEDHIIDVGQEMLKSIGYHVLIAQSGREALDVYRKQKDKIDLIILDMIMPDMGGEETYDRLKNIDEGVTVLLSSGYSINGEAKKILSRGCNGFIQKPYTLQELSIKVRQTLEGNRQGS